MHNDPNTSAHPRARIMTDHPGWLTCPGGCVRRAFRSGETVWTVVCGPPNNPTPPTIAIHTPKGAALAELPTAQATFDPATLPKVLQEAEPIRSSERLHRLPTPDLWDAILPLVLRHRVRTSEATKKYRKLCARHGTIVETTAGPALLPPRPATVATLTEEALADVGLGSRANRLRTVANAYITHAESWQQLSPTDLFTNLQAAPYIGKWTAGATIADITNDFSYYTFSGRPAYTQWEELFTALETHLTEYQFQNIWDVLERQQLSTLVALTLASKCIVRAR